MTPLSNIFSEVEREHNYARAKWGPYVDRKVNLPADWVSYITHYVTMWMDGSFRPYSRQTLLNFRRSMVKVANLAVSAIYEIDLILDGENDRPDVVEDQPEGASLPLPDFETWVKIADDRAARRSPDPSRKSACLFINEDTGDILAEGVNTFAQGILPKTERLERPANYSWIMHAEIKAVAQAARSQVSLEGSTAVLNWFPCAPCANSLVDVGVRRVVCLEPNWDDPNYNFIPAYEALEEAGVQIVFAGKYAQG